MANRTCTVDGCTDPHEARGWCVRHYKRWRRNGDPTAGRTPVGATDRWLRDLLSGDPGSDCIEWPYATNDKGYGQVSRDGAMVRVTHLVLERTGRPRPEPPNHHALHSCDNPPCVNPAHLRWGSNGDNITDREEGGRTRRALTADEAKIIRRQYASGSVTQQDLANLHGVSRSSVGRVIRREVHP